LSAPRSALYRLVAADRSLFFLVLSSSLIVAQAEAAPMRLMPMQGLWHQPQCNLRRWQIRAAHQNSSWRDKPETAQSRESLPRSNHFVASENNAFNHGVRNNLAFQVMKQLLFSAFMMQARMPPTSLQHSFGLSPNSIHVSFQPLVGGPAFLPLHVNLTCKFNCV